MQTFLPYPDFARSARCLDTKRLGKQRVEADQLVDTVLIGSGWSNHPAARMWSGYVAALVAYRNAVIDEWVRRGYRNSIIVLWRPELPELPPWFGREDFHSAHRAALLAKDYAHYSQFGWSESPRISYIWPI